MPRSMLLQASRRSCCGPGSRRQNGEALGRASEELRGARNVVVAIRRNDKVLPSVSAGLRNDRDMVLEA